jgi:hypothetical protein
VRIPCWKTSSARSATSSRTTWSRSRKPGCGKPRKRRPRRTSRRN